MVAVLSCNRLYSSHMSNNVFIQSSGATVKAVTASQVEYMLLIIAMRR
jgi:hypothetical protein